MNLLSCRIPEIEKLPLEERQAFVVKCLEAPRIRAFKRFAPLVGAFVATTVSMGFFLYAVFVGGWAFLPAFATFVALCIVSMALVVAFKIAGEIILLRSEVRRRTQR